MVIGEGKALSERASEQAIRRIRRGGIIGRTTASVAPVLQATTDDSYFITNITPVKGARIDECPCRDGRGVGIVR